MGAIPSKNENCLAGMRCPACNSLEPFIINVYASALVFDEGINEYNHTDWEDDSTCTCFECGHHATVEDFQIKTPMEMLAYNLKDVKVEEEVDEKEE